MKKFFRISLICMIVSLISVLVGCKNNKLEIQKISYQKMVKVNMSL